MVPLRLVLKNFMSYGDEPTLVDFEDMHVICLSGENGHGKSALLDAITWALWGETRLGKQSHDQLVRIGADEMSVILDFQNGGETYRARRQRSRKSSGNIWELQIEEAGGSWRSLTAQGASDTGKVIADLLRMSYETFLNSAYLRQGRADEFVRQSANKRKEILAKILDLARYDDLEAHARAKMRESADHATDENRAINQIDAELGNAIDAGEKLDIIEQQIAAVVIERDMVAQATETLADARAQLNAQKSRLIEHTSQISELGKRKDAQQLQIAADESIIDAALKLLGEKDVIEQNLRTYNLLSQRLEQLQAETSRFRLLDARRLQLETMIAAARKELDRDLKEAESEMRVLTQALEALPQIELRLNKLGANQSQLRPLQQRISALDTDRQNLRAKFAELGADKKRCDADIEEAEKRLERVLDQNENCSICGSPLPEEKLRSLAEECALIVEALRERLSLLKREGNHTKTDIEHVDLELREANANEARLQEARLEIATLEQKQHQLREQQTKESTLQRDIDALQLKIAQEDYAPAQALELQSLLPEHARLIGVEADLVSTQQALRPLRTAEAAQLRLDNAERELMAAETRQKSAQAILIENEAQMAQLRALSADAPKVDQQLAQNRTDREKNTAQAASVAGQLQQAERERGRLQHVIERATLLKVQRAERSAALQNARNDEELYTLLAGAFGKRGVQALIIENALPELELDANELLQRLTDGQMSLTLQTTRVAKAKSSGDAPIETLEVVISDALGSRPLEMYSGGEAFRISFALRIALSKLLARHAGAQLQTLIIDEGFGTQDARGREKLVDSIMAVQADFAQIIVITHVDEIKDAFPNRIEVYKTSTGSEVNLVVGAALG